MNGRQGKAFLFDVHKMFIMHLYSFLNENITSADQYVTPTFNPKKDKPWLGLVLLILISFPLIRSSQ